MILRHGGHGYAQGNHACGRHKQRCCTGHLDVLSTLVYFLCSEALDVTETTIGRQLTMRGCYYVGVQFTTLTLKNLVIKEGRLFSWPERLIVNLTPSTSSFGDLTYQIFLSSGDVVRPHDDGTMDQTGEKIFAEVRLLSVE